MASETTTPPPLAAALAASDWDPRRQPFENFMNAIAGITVQTSRALQEATIALRRDELRGLRLHLARAVLAAARSRSGVFAEEGADEEARALARRAVAAASRVEELVVEHGDVMRQLDALRFEAAPGTIDSAAEEEQAPPGAAGLGGGAAVKSEEEEQAPPGAAGLGGGAAVKSEEEEQAPPGAAGLGGGAAAASEEQATAGAGAPPERFISVQIPVPPEEMDRLLVRAAPLLGFLLQQPTVDLRGTELLSLICAGSVKKHLHLRQVRLDRVTLQLDAFTAALARVQVGVGVDLATRDVASEAAELLEDEEEAMADDVAGALTFLAFEDLLPLPPAVLDARDAELHAALVAALTDAGTADVPAGASVRVLWDLLRTQWERMHREYAERVAAANPAVPPQPSE